MNKLEFYVICLCLFVGGFSAGYVQNPRPYRPWGKQVPDVEVMIHRTDPHKIYTCESDQVPDSSVHPNHYAIIDQKEALNASYTPAGQGYCQ